MEPASPLGSYARARAAAAAGEIGPASAGFAAAMDAAPDSDLIAGQALAHAVTAGDWPLALRAARTLDRRGALPPDARFLLVAEAFRSGEWRAAARQVDAVEREQLFAFAVPVLRAWLAFGSGRGDPLATLPKRAAGVGLPAAYASEHRPLLLVAMRRAEGPLAIREAAEAAGPRAIRLRLAAAALLARRGEREAALSLLEGDSPAIAAARQLVERGRPLAGAVADAPAGVAELMVRIALDLHVQDLTPVALSFARMATWLAPDSAEGRMVLAELLAEDERPELAVALLDETRPDGPYAAAVRDQRVRLLIGAGLPERALGEAEAAAAAGGATAADQVRLGQVLMDRKRPADAARAFARALELRRESDADLPEWTLWLFRGGAHEEADDWPQARAALERAYALAPDQPLVLNYLGYAQLERRENLEEAERLVREAHRLAPENAAITDSLGWALFLKGDLAEAIPLLERAVEGEPADVEINEHLGDAYFAAGRRLEARFAWRAALVYAEDEDAERLRAKIATGLTPQLAAR